MRQRLVVTFFVWWNFRAAERPAVFALNPFTSEQSVYHREYYLTLFMLPRLATRGDAVMFLHCLSVCPLRTAGIADNQPRSVCSSLLFDSSLRHRGQYKEHASGYSCILSKWVIRSWKKFSPLASYTTNVTDIQTDRQADRSTDTDWRHRPCLCIAIARQNP